MSYQHSYLDDVAPDGSVVVTLPTHVPLEIIEAAVSKIARTDFGSRSVFMQEGHRVTVHCEPMAFVDSAVDHLVDVIRGMVTGRYNERPLPESDGQMPF
jgi:hypothetical protein